jgi:hypothetical protein
MRIEIYKSGELFLTYVAALPDSGFTEESYLIRRQMIDMKVRDTMNQVATVVKDTRAFTVYVVLESKMNYQNLDNEDH